LSKRESAGGHAAQTSVQSNQDADERFGSSTCWHFSSGGVIGCRSSDGCVVKVTDRDRLAAAAACVDERLN